MKANIEEHTVESLGYDREECFPKWASDLHSGRALCTGGVEIEQAQDRVMLRRLIRRAFPSLAVAVRDMGTEELSEIYNSIAVIRG